MKYSIVKNGLWGTRALEREQFDGSRGGLFGTNLDNARPYTGPTPEQIAELLEGLEAPRERSMVMHTGEEGMRQLDRALQEEVERQMLSNQGLQDLARSSAGMSLITGTGGENPGHASQYEELWNQVRNSNDSGGIQQIQYVDPPISSDRYIVGIDPITEDSPVYTQRVGTTNARDINYMRLQRGDISTLEYLDLISEEE